MSGLLSSVFLKLIMIEMNALKKVSDLKLA